jgi:alkylation response protein AidB-like acyl-CoA dehydrogenase
MTHTAKDLLAGIRELAPCITERAAEIETARRIPPDLVDALRSVGIFRMLVPQSHGGMELALPAAMEVISALGRIDGAAAWTVMIASGCDMITALLPQATYDQVYHAGPDIIMAGSAQPAGTADAANGFWRVSGRWPFASGCLHAGWMFALCLMTADGKPLPGPAGEQGPPLVRGCILPAQDWQIEDTWHAGGLKGTGSHHITLRDAIVPDANFFDIAPIIPCRKGPLYQSPLHFLPLLHGAFAVGVAEGALSELVELANTGRQQQRAAVPMRDSETFQDQLGRVEADTRAARALLEAQAASHWRHAEAGSLNTEALFTQGNQAAIWIATTCVRAVDACFTLGGGGAVYESSPLQRRLRDLHIAAQHAVVQQRHYAAAGKLLLAGNG